MAQQTRAQLKAAIESLLADNTSRAISAADVRSILVDIADSMAFEATNTAPTVVTPIPDQTFTVGVVVALDVASNFADTGDTLTFSATGLPAGLSISTAGVISGTPTLAAGASDVTVTATDTADQSVSDTFSVTVSAAPFLALDELTRDRLIFDSGAAMGLDAGAIPLSGTATAGFAVEARAVSVDDGGATTTAWASLATAGGSGDYSGTLTVPRSGAWYRPEVRLAAATSTVAQGSNRFGVGHVFAIWGQSEFARMYTTFYSTLTPVQIVDDEAVQMVWHDRGTPGAGGVNHHFVVDGDAYTAAFAAMAASLIAARPSDKFLIVHQTHSGTSFQDLCDDAQGVRSFADDLALHTYATAGGVKVGLALSSWFASPRGFQSNYGQALLAAFTGRSLSDGSVIAAGTTMFAGDGSREFVLDHSLAELYDPSETIYALAGPHRFSLVSGQDYNSSGLSAIEDCRNSQRSLIASNPSPFTIRAAAEAMDYLNGAPADTPTGPANPAGTSWWDTSHPNTTTEDGQNRFARITAHGLLQAAGLETWAIPEIDGCTWAADRITLTSSAGAITTKALSDGGSAAVVGFEVNGAEVTTASVVNGAIEISGSFASGDVLSFGRYGGTGMRTFPDDYFSARWANYPLVAHSLSDLEGIAVRPLPSAAVLANTLVLVGGGSFETQEDDIRFDDPQTVPAAQTQYVGIADITTAAALASGTIFGMTGGTIKIEILSNGALRVNLRDGGGAVLLSNAFSSGVFSTSTAYVVKAHVDLVAGYCRVWVNDTLEVDETFTASTPEWPTARRLGFLSDPATFTNHLSNTVVRQLTCWFTGANLAGTDPTVTVHHNVNTGDHTNDNWYVSA